MSVLTRLRTVTKLKSISESKASPNGEMLGRDYLLTSCDGADSGPGPCCASFSPLPYLLRG